MPRRSPPPIAVALTAALVLLLTGATGCASGDENTGSDETTTGTPESTPSASETKTPSPSASSPSGPRKPSPNPNSGKRLQVTISGGEVSPVAEQVEVTVGTTVILTVTSDVDEELHVHGYDREYEIRAGRTAEFRLVASETGRFEIETHESESVVYLLLVTP